MKRWPFLIVLLLCCKAYAQRDTAPAARQQRLYDSAMVLKQAGIRYGKAGVHDSSISSSLQALRLFEQLGDQKQAAETEWALAAIYVVLRQYDKATYYSDRGVADANSVQDWRTLGLLLMTRSAIASGNRGSYQVTGEAYTLNREAYRLFRLSGDTVKGADALNNIGAYFSESEHRNYDSAVHYYQAAKEIHRRYGRNASVAVVNDNLARLFLLQQRYAEARDYALEAVQLSTAEKDNEMLRKSYMKLTMIYGYLHMPDSVSYYANAYATVVRTIFSDRLSANLSEAEARYKTGRQQQQIDLLHQQNTIQQLQLGRVKLVVDNQELALSRNQLLLKNRNLELANQQALLARKQLEAAEKQQQINLLNQENTIQKLAISQRNTTIMSIAILFLIACLTGALLYNRYKLKQEALLQAEMIRQQERTTRGIIEAEERERKRIAADLHDGVGQLFSAVRLNLGGLMERISLSNAEDTALARKTLAMVDESCREVRTIAHQMMPNILMKNGLVPAVRDFLNKIDAGALQVTMETDGLSGRLDNNTELVLYRVIQECVNNVIRHAAASRLDIQLTGDGHGIALTVEDNGRGFDLRDQEHSGGIGLKNIRTRLAYLKGTVEFSSAPGKGTLVALYIPLAKVLAE